MQNDSFIEGRTTIPDGIKMCKHEIETLSISARMARLQVFCCVTVRVNWGADLYNTRQNYVLKLNILQHFSLGIEGFLTFLPKLTNDKDYVTDL